MTEQQTQASNWLDEELKTFNQPTGDNCDYERLESLKLESGKVTKFIIDFSKPFRKWTKTENDETTIKAIIPVTHKDVKKNLWLNVRNPLYRQLCERGKAGKFEVRVSATGSQADTRYQIVEED